MLKGIWIVEANGPCLYKLVADERFLEIDENLVSGFFAALHAFAKTIGSEEVEGLVLRDVSFSFAQKSNALIVAATDKGADVKPILDRIGFAFDEVFSGAETSPFNPLIPTDLDRMEQEISAKIRDIVTTTKVVPHEKPEATRAGMVPRMQKSLTGILRRASREREMLVKRFGIIAVDILHYVNGERTIDQIVVETGVSRNRIDEILDFASKVGVVKFS
jgi:hypothetical protein